MSAAQIRQRLHELIEIAEDKKLKAIYALLEDDAIDHQLSVQQKEELDRRYNDHINGIGRTYTWTDTVAMAHQALADRKVIK